MRFEFAADILAENCGDLLCEPLLVVLQDLPSSASISGMTVPSGLQPPKPLGLVVSGQIPS